MAQNSDFVEENIDRLIKQVENGDEAMSFLAIYSFIEGYFRKLFPYFKFGKKMSDGKNKHYDFGEILSESSENLKFEKNGKECTLYEELKLYHSSWKKDLLQTNSSTNAIRHEFATIRAGSLSVVVGQFIKFADYRGFLTNKISKMSFCKQVMDSRKKIQLEVSDDSVLHNLKNDLLSRYDEIFVLRKKKSAMEYEQDNIDAKFMEESNERILIDLIRQRKQNTKDIEELELQLDAISEYSDFINELAISLIEARTRKNYEMQIIHLSGDQKRLIKEAVDDLARKEGHSMYIKGGPGTGKTLVLIVVLFKLYYAGQKSVLLTYYPTLNKYIDYLFNLYNDDKLLNDFGLSKINSASLDILASKGILKFDDFLLQKIRELLNIKNTYSLRENESKLTEVCHSVEPNEKKSVRLYKEIVENVLPNFLDEQRYCTTPRKKERWKKILQVLRLLDDSDNMLDLYAYYKFCIKDIDKIALSNESYDYILIDEAQDLTNAQIFAVNKFVSKKGGMILAGDPSQEIRNKRISMAQLDVTISGGKRYNPELTQNFRSSNLIQNLGNEYKQEPCLHIRKNTKSVEGFIAGPPPQIFITEDTEETDYQNTYAQIVNSVRMCTEDLCIVPENICIVAFNETELMAIQQKLESELKMKSALIYKSFSFKNSSDTSGKVRLCTLREIKGIDCAVLLFMVIDQSKQKNNGGIISELKANAIYTCITRAMYLLQVFVPRYCRMSDLSVAVLVNKLCPNDSEVAAFVDEQNKKERKGIPIKSYFEQYNNEPETEILKKIETTLRHVYEQKFGSDENCDVQYSEDLMIAYVYARKKVVDIVQDELTEISLSDALSIRPECTIDDEIEIYINPNMLDINKSESNTPIAENCEYVKLLYEKYELFPERRTNEMGLPLPNSSEGFLNISGCGLTKPIEFGYEKWTDLIKDNTDKFDYVIYNGKGTVRIFAYRPKPESINSNPQNSSIDVDDDFINKGYSFKGTIKDSNLILVRKYIYTRADGKIAERTINDLVPDKFYAYINEALYASKCEIGTQMKFGLRKLGIPKTINGELVHFEICEPIIVLNEKSKSSENSSQKQDRAGDKKLIQTVKKEWDPSLQDYIYTNKIKGPSPRKLDCINVWFNDTERPNIHSLEIWRDKNSLFSECTKGTKVKYKVMESDSGYLQAIVLEILE